MRLLKRFRESESDFADRYRKALEAGDHETAVRLAHTLKGLAATLGAPALRSAAAELERASAEHRAEDSLLQATLDELMPLLESLQQLESGEPAGISGGNPSQLLADLRRALDEHDASAVDIGGQLAKTALGQEQQGLVAELLRSLQNYEFDQSIEVLQKLEQALSND